MLMIAPQGQKVGPARLQPPAGVSKWRKATVKKRRNTAPGFKALDPNIQQTQPLEAKKVNSIEQEYNSDK